LLRNAEQWLEITVPPNKGMKQTKPSILELRSLSPVFGGPKVVNVGTMQRVRVNAGRFALGCLVLVLAAMAWSQYASGDTRGALLVGAFAVFLGQYVVFSQFEPDWRDELPPPPSLFRSAIGGVIWLAIGVMMSFPRVVSRTLGDDSAPRWLALLILVFFSLPACALVHVELSSRLGTIARAKTRWAISKLGPIGAAGYLLGFSEARGRRTRG
jgi:hypothetical protein